MGARDILKSIGRRLEMGHIPGARYERLVSRPMAITNPTKPAGKKMPGFISDLTLPTDHWQGRVSVKNTAYAYMTGADRNTRTGMLTSGIGRTAVLGGAAALAGLTAMNKARVGIEQYAFGQRVPESRGRFGQRSNQLGMSRPLSTSLDMMNYRRRKMASDYNRKPRWI